MYVTDSLFTFIVNLFIMETLIENNSVIGNGNVGTENNTEMYIEAN